MRPMPKHVEKGAGATFHQKGSEQRRDLATTTCREVIERGAKRSFVSDLNCGPERHGQTVNVASEHWTETRKREYWRQTASHSAPSPDGQARFPIATQHELVVHAKAFASQQDVQMLVAPARSLARQRAQALADLGVRRAPRAIMPARTTQSHERASVAGTHGIGGYEMGDHARRRCVVVTSFAPPRL